MEPYLTGTEASGLYEARLGAQEMPGKEVHVFCAGYREDEFEELLEIYNKYPLKELIIHPRVRSDFYKNTPDRAAFCRAVKASKNEVWYNGDIFTAGDWKEFHAGVPEVDCIMMGRGLLANPGLAGEIKGLGGPDKEWIREFHDMVYQGTGRRFPVTGMSCLK